MIRSRQERPNGGGGDLGGSKHKEMASLENETSGLQEAGEKRGNRQSRLNPNGNS